MAEARRSQADEKPEPKPSEEKKADVKASEKPAEAKKSRRAAFAVHDVGRLRAGARLDGVVSDDVLENLLARGFAREAE